MSGLKLQIEHIKYNRNIGSQRLPTEGGAGITFIAHYRYKVLSSNCQTPRWATHVRLKKKELFWLHE